MEVLPKDLEKLKDIWADPQTKQSAQVVLLKALMDIPRVDMEVLTALFSNLDDLLQEKEEEKRRKVDPAL